MAAGELEMAGFHLNLDSKTKIVDSWLSAMIGVAVGVFTVFSR